MPDNLRRLFESLLAKLDKLDGECHEQLQIMRQLTNHWKGM